MSISDGSFERLFAGSEQAIADNEQLFEEMMANVPELCRPRVCEIDNDIELGCLNIRLLAGNALRKFSEGDYTLEEAIKGVRCDLKR